MPPDTWLLRESFQGPGAERTGNWWGRFDDEGCWWEAHNTWLIVSDSELVKSPSWFLHWNGQEGDHPWFCLTEHQKQSLREATTPWEKYGNQRRYTGAIERWTVQTDQGEVSQVIQRDSAHRRVFPIYELFRQFSADGVWGQSPETDLVDLRRPQHP